MKKRRLFGILLSLALMLTMMPGMMLTAYADSTKAYANYDVTTDANKNKSVDELAALQVNFNGKPWYIIADNSDSATEGKVTLLAADTSFGRSEFNNTNDNAYGGSTVQQYLLGLTTTGGFKVVAEAISDTNLNDVGGVVSKLYLLSTEEASNLPVNVRKINFNSMNGVWWLRTRTENDTTKVTYVRGDNGTVRSGTNGASATQNYGVRPAMQLDLSKVTFDSATQTFSMLEYYPLWVGDTQVTSANKDNVLAGDPVNDDKVSYKPAKDGEPATLTLKGLKYKDEGHEINGSYAAIASGEVLNIELQGDDNTVIHTKGDTNSYGIVSTKNLTITGSGTLTVESSDTSAGASYGIYLTNSNITLTIDEGATLKAKAGKSDPESGYSVGVRAKKVEVKGTLDTRSNETARYSAGIHANDPVVEIGNEAKVYASGKRAISGTVKNNVDGTGWMDDTGDAEKIAVNTAGQTLSYKTVQFPKAIAEVEDEPEPKSLTYKGLAQQLVTEGKAKSGEMQYALGTVDGPTSNWSSDIPAGTVAGNYYVWYKATGEAYSDSEPQYVPVTISKAAAVPATVTANSRKYDGTEKPLVNVTGNAEGGTMQYALGTATEATGEYSTTIPKGTDKGTYYVWSKVVGDANHNDSDPLCVKVTISEKDPVESTIKFKLNGGTLDGKTGTVTVKAVNGTVITLPKPTRKGYEFDYWEGSKYNAGDKYTVNGDHTFKAVWKTAGGSSKKGANTGDDNNVIPWVALMVMAAGGLTVMLRRSAKGKK